ncbi:RNA polymerase sigma factor [Nocardia terpenica]|uniref:Sigma-70 family RNA polymerase sigma factor n=1 Tax=Nocardia terpenica TaxID=455432 RepID=A0A6G9YYW7_9NOCA|nr:sigma-70 family RNA polymerase sigma factor [Nocardia terpenica]QIS18414.1 sigma-70 family RNA polymerase sigma factor [Nocardia terpenica]
MRKTVTDDPGRARERDGSRERWHLVYAHRTRLVELARRRLPSVADAEDCVHEAFLRAVGHPRLDPDRAGGFLTVTVLRLCVDFHRRAQRTDRLLYRLRDPGYAPAPEQIVLAHSAALAMLEAVTRLPHRQRQVVCERLGGSSTAEAAGRLGVSVKSAESALTRARARLAREQAMAAL